MEPSPEEGQRRMARFADVLRAARLKRTPQRMHIFQAVAKAGDHPDAVQAWKHVCRTMSNVSLDTVYRTLWLFVDLGLIKTLGPPRERTRFDSNVELHHHFVCNQCGKACDVLSQDFAEPEIPPAVSSLGRVELTVVEFRGSCASCLAAKACETAPE